MPLRDVLIKRTTASLLGPRTPLEALPPNRDPQDEYITGVLAPRPLPGAAPPPLPDPEAEAELLDGDDTPDDEEQDTGLPLMSVGGIAPVLDPRSRASSMGLTFIVEASETPRLTVCVTFARYGLRDDDWWQREPYAWFSDELEAAQASAPVLPLPGNAQLHIRVSAVPANPLARRVSLFLVNSCPPPPADQRIPTPDLIFQPQIRVAVSDGTHVSAMNRTVSSIDPADLVLLEEEQSLELLYRDSPILARGHMCAALWADIDPERDLPDGTHSPFSWADGLAVSDQDRARFLCPDVRTEFVPIYSVTAPSTTWRPEFGPEPLLRPAALAELWDPAALHAALVPLAEAYDAWITSVEAGVSQADPLAPVVARHMQQCRAVRDRILDGIALLNEDDEARLAFCFANRAIALQAEWQGRDLTWRPFQLAFILLCARGIAEPNHASRELCDLLWFATGGGKTEAYLGLAAFTLALRRLRADHEATCPCGETGTGVISRYTLRLLTIQQFRRALGLITACELLRVAPHQAGGLGWRPQAHPSTADIPWGQARFSAGLWAGSGVTPNKLGPVAQNVPGAIELLQQPGTGHGDPAQVLRCPCCRAHLAIPLIRNENQERPPFPAGRGGELHYVIYCDGSTPPLTAAQASTARVILQDDPVWTPHPVSGYYTLSIRFTAGPQGVSAQALGDWWINTIMPRLPGISGLQCSHVSRPGYFLRTYPGLSGPSDFEIYCPNPACPLADVAWQEAEPSVTAPGRSWREVIEPFRTVSGAQTGSRVPIPALTVDEQVYSRPPSLIVSTVDKFARLAFEPQAASFFGNVTHYHPRIGYYRIGIPRIAGANRAHPTNPHLSRSVPCLPPPDLVLQDELHLIEGPLGSMVGLYETAIDELSSRPHAAGEVRPKYIASTATVRQAAEQVTCLFRRTLVQFPPPGVTARDNFFSRVDGAADPHPALDASPGRVYLGVCAPGRGAQTPIIRIWSALLQFVYEERGAYPPPEVDRFWTLVGYFNAIRELAGAAGMYRQDIPQWIAELAGINPPRDLPEEIVELSSRADSLQLPGLLSRLEDTFSQGGEDAALSTSMFGTGVDVARLGLMVVHGQPKTTSSYIQATGRVGREHGGLVVTFLRASRPRDLNHYEFFTGYHRQLYRAVEPVTVAPFSPRARDRGLGPLCTALLRQAQEIAGSVVDAAWRYADPVQGAQRMANARSSAEVMALPDLFEQRAMSQPEMRRPPQDQTRAEVAAELDRWRAIAQAQAGQNGLRYHEYTLNSNPTVPVVLGDPQHQQQGFAVAFEDAPQSLREVERTTGFKV